jgi:Asp-tRNA(Asn)/Glu-tRNA(Gln) amidotransferase A subunit family amidase
VLQLSRTLDHVGLFARTLEDLALLGEQLAGFDARDPDTRVRARPDFVSVAGAEPPMPPLLAFVKTPVWERAADDLKEGFAELVAALGDRVVEIDLPESARQAWDWQRTIMEAEMAANFAAEWERGRDKLSPQLHALLERGREVRAFDYQSALARIPLLNEGFAEIFERCDAILTPSALGTAPKGLDATGDPACCTLWKLCGMPAVSLPLMQGANGLPMGVQLVGPREGDARLLRTARWLASQAA